MKKNRRWLYVVLAAGLIGLGASGGTFATFNAQTTNAGNTFSTGSLYLTDATNGQTCTSDTSASNQVTTGCDGIVKVDAGSEEPGDVVANTVTITNSGTLPASNFYLSAPDSSGTLDSSSALTENHGFSSIALDGTNGIANVGDLLVLSEGENSQTVEATGVSGNAVTVEPVANYSYDTSATGSDSADSSTFELSSPLSSNVGFAELSLTSTSGAISDGALLQLTENGNTEVVEATEAYTGSTAGTVSVEPVANYSYDTSATVADENCQDSYVGGSSLGALNTTTGNPLCASLQMFVLETGQSAGGSSSANLNLWYGGSGTPYAALDSASNASQLSFSGPLLGTSIASGDTLAVITPKASGDEGNATVQICTATGAASSMASSVTIASTLTVPSGSYVVDLSQLDPSDTVASFDGGAGASSGIELKPLSSSGTQGSGTELAPNEARTFLVGLYLPSTAGNNLQNLTSTFGLSWYINQ